MPCWLFAFTKKKNRDLLEVGKDKGCVCVGGDQGGGG
jgi:hypothetical protein